MLRPKFVNFSTTLWCFVLCIQFESVVPTQPMFKEDAMIVEGQTISSSEIKLLLVDRHNVSEIQVYLTHTFYGDEDLKLNGIKAFHIFANNWKITHPITFDLSGSAEMDGGKFFGLANETVNGSYLTVMSNSGSGTGAVGDGHGSRCGILVLAKNAKNDASERSLNSDESCQTTEMERASLVLRYKRFLMRNMMNSSLTFDAQEMYAAIDRNQELNVGNSLGGLVLEASELEKNYFELTKSKIEVLPMYRRLFDRVESLKKRALNDNGERVGLSHLQLILQFKLKDLQRNYEPIIPNLDSYTEWVNGSIHLRNQRLPAIKNVNDTELQTSLNELRFGVNGNFILTYYHHVVEGFRLSHFPFAAEYLEELSISESLSAYNDLEEITIAATKSLKALSQSIFWLRFSHSDNMMIVNHIDYDDALFAFQIWKNAEVRDEIRQLFEGKKVTLFADVKSQNDNGRIGYNAMKFKTIDIIFRSRNNSINDQLYEALQSFQLRLNHTGSAIFRCNDKYFNITTRPLTIQRSFQKDKDDVPMYHTLNYDLLRENDQPTLSPFAYWEIQIVRDVESSKTFSALTPFAQYDFDIELHGTGRYITEDIPICKNQNMARFYTQV